MMELQEFLALEREHLALRQRYVRLKMDYWRAVQAGDDARVERTSAEARALAGELTHARRQ
jgi:hypothetical protein